MPVACWPIREGSPDKHLFQCKPECPIIEATALRFCVFDGLGPEAGQRGQSCLGPVPNRLGYRPGLGQSEPSGGPPYL